MVGLAAAGQGVNFGSIPIINTAGQPVVQIVVGSGAKPSDGVVAANIAAVIGSLAHTSTSITATVSGRSGVRCVVTTPTCTLSNQQVWLGEQGLVVPTGSYSFSALIGSVLNPGVLNSGNLQYTKTLQGSSGGNYAYPEGASPYVITSNPLATSAYAGIGVSPSAAPSASTNGGGVSFSGFTKSVSGSTYDNILQLSNAQVPGLLSNSGNTKETENLWLAGFPVYDQATGALSVLDVNGAYAITFGKPITNTTDNYTSGEAISLLGQNWTVYNLVPPSNSALSGVYSGNFVLGGNVTLAQATTPATIVYVGHNLTSGAFKVVLNDLSYPTSNGLANAAISVYKNGVLTNVTSVGPANGASGETAVINASGSKLYIKVTETFPGLYAYQKWAKIQLFSNTLNVSNGKYFDSANKEWLTALRWTTNQTSSGHPTSQNAALQGIILYNGNTSVSQPTLTAGSTFDYIGSPSAWQVLFAGDSLGVPSSGNSNYDVLTMKTANTGTPVVYSNPNGDGLVSPTAYTFNAVGNPTTTGASAVQQVNATTVSEPENQFTVSSHIPTAFQITSAAGFPAPTSSVQNVTYNVDPYSFAPNNALDAKGLANVVATGTGGLVLEVVNNGVNSIYLNSTETLPIYVNGYQGTATRQDQFTANGFGAGDFATAGSNIPLTNYYLTNVTGIRLGYALPYPGVNVMVYETANTANGLDANNALLLGTLTYSNGPDVQYSVPSYSYQISQKATTVYYTGEQNNVNSILTALSPDTHLGGRKAYYQYIIPEITVPGSTTVGANIIVDLTNSTSGAGRDSPLYYLNKTSTYNNALEYQGTSATINASQGFRTERGGEVSSISTAQVVYDEPKSVDGLSFIVGPSTNANANTLNTKLYGPYGVGQATNIANVTIGKVNATCAFSTTSCNVTGLANLTAVPSASQAVVPTVLNTASTATPLAVLDSNANNATTLIVVGSSFVNSVAGQIFAQNPSFNSTFMQGPSSADAVTVKAFGTNRILVAGYTAQQTVTAGDQFISDLLANATS